MKPSTNILLTSLSKQGDRKTHRYFFFNGKDGMKYCDGLSVAEAGAKYILSDISIDEIIVLGSGRTYDKGQELKRVVLKEWSDYAVNDTKDLSEYSFLQYRIAQFIDGLDMEAIDVLEDMDKERGEEILKKYNQFCNEIKDVQGYRPDQVFHLLSQNEDIYQKMLEMIPDLTDKELLWLERTIYTAFSDNMKLRCKQENDDILICFVPTSKDQTNNYVPAQNVSQIVNVINEIDAERINIYMDMQGLASTEGYTILAVLSMLSGNYESRINIKEIITSHYRAGQFAGYIDNNEMKRYDINRLVSGMSAFVSYGKVDEILNYWKSRHIENKHVDSLLNAMRRVDEGISLCNTADLETGINYLKYVFQNTPKNDLPEVESNIFRILENSIKMDYGKLLDGENVDALELVRWATRKGFYQQSLTIIESRIPRSILDDGIFYYADSEESKAKAMEEFNKLYWQNAPKDRWGFDDLAHYFIKFYGRSQIRQTHQLQSNDRQKDFTYYRCGELDGSSEGVMKAYSVLCEKKELLENLLYAYYHLGEVRNHVNHAEDRPSADFTEMNFEDENENIKLLRLGIEYFINAYDEARKYIAETVKEPVVNMQITSKEFKAYVNEHREFNDRNQKSNNRYFRKKDFNRNRENSKNNSEHKEQSKDAGEKSEGDKENKSFGYKKSDHYRSNYSHNRSNDHHENRDNNRNHNDQNSSFGSGNAKAIHVNSQDGSQPIIQILVDYRK